MAESRCLQVFARAAVRGRVKRRLAGGLGESGALAAHLELLEGTLERVVSPGDYRTELWLGGEPDPHSRALAERFGLAIRAQQGADLGERMGRALDTALTAGAHAVLIGSDCPTIDAGYVRDAFDALFTHDVVVGPAEDGGYGLLGLARAAPELFRGIPWGTRDVLDRTLAAAAQARLRVAQLATIYDVDTPGDWARYRASRASG